MRLKFSRVLVTGGAGFIASHLVESLVANGCEVTVLDDLSTGSLSNLEPVRSRIVFYQGDIRDRELLAKAVKDCEVIFHLAAVVSVPRTVECPAETAMTNEMGTLFVLEAARAHAVKRVVLASSCAVYGDDTQLPKQEDMNPKPPSPYAVQKLVGEFYARLYNDLYGIQTVCLRYFNVYGPRQDPSSPYSGVISVFMTKAVLKVPPVIFGDGNQYRDFVFVMDVVRATLLAASSDHAAGKVFNVGTGRFIRINELWETIERLSGTGLKPAYEPPRPGEIRESVADIDQARTGLGFEPEYSLENGLQVTLNWYKTRILQN